MANRGGGIVQAIVVNPLKSFFGAIFLLCVVLILLFPPEKAIATIGWTTMTVYRVGGVVIGTIPVGIQEFRNGFEQMSNYEPKPSGWNGATPAPKPNPKQTCPTNVQGNC